MVGFPSHVSFAGEPAGSSGSADGDSPVTGAAARVFDVATTRRRPVIFDAGAGPVQASVYRREELLAGNEIDGPAVIGQVDATTLLPPGSKAQVDDHGNLLISV